MILERSQVDAISGRRSDQSGPSHMHLAKGLRHLGNRRDLFHDKLVRQKSLIDQLDHALVRWFQPNGPEMLSSDFHVARTLTPARANIKSETGRRDRFLNLKPVLPASYP